MRLWEVPLGVIIFVGAATGLSALAHDATDRSEDNRHLASALKKFIASPYYCDQMVDDRGSGDSLSAEFSKELDAALKATRKPANVAVKEVQSICEKRLHGTDLARVKSGMGL